MLLYTPIDRHFVMRFGYCVVFSQCCLTPPIVYNGKQRVLQLFYYSVDLCIRYEVQKSTNCICLTINEKNYEQILISAREFY